MIQSTDGRDDLEYRYHCRVEEWALLNAEQHEHKANGPDCRYMGDPAFESEYPELEWVRIGSVSWASESVAMAGKMIRRHLGESFKGERDGEYYRMGPVVNVTGRVLYRSLVTVRHDASVPESEWMGSSDTPHDGEGEQ